jgi:hypothetical protein
MVLALEAKPDCQPALEAMVQLGVLTPIYENPRDAASLTYVRTDAVVDYLTSQWDAEPRDAEATSWSSSPITSASSATPWPSPRPSGSSRCTPPRWAPSAPSSRGSPPCAPSAAPTRPSPPRSEYIAKLEKMGTIAPIPPAAAAGAQVELAKCLAATGKVEEGKAAVNRAWRSTRAISTP